MLASKAAAGQRDKRRLVFIWQIGVAPESVSRIGHRNASGSRKADQSLGKRTKFRGCAGV